MVGQGAAINSRAIGAKGERSEPKNLGVQGYSHGKIFVAMPFKLAWNAIIILQRKLIMSFYNILWLFISVCSRHRANIIMGLAFVLWTLKSKLKTEYMFEEISCLFLIIK